MRRALKNEEQNQSKLSSAQFGQEAAFRTDRQPGIFTIMPRLKNALVQEPVL